MEEIKNHFLLESYDIINKIIKTKQSEHNNKNYDEKSPSDKLTCIVCNGNFTRKSKNVHDSTNKHKKALEKLYKYILNN